MGTLGGLHTKKTPQETRFDIGECFEKWGIEEFRVLGDGKAGSATAAEVLFWPNDRKQSIRCDRFWDYRTNLRAVYLILEPMRLASQRGILEELARAAVAMLPEGRIQKPPHEVLGVARDAPMTVAQAAYKALAKERHPDAGGSHEAMQELNEAWESFQSANGVQR